MENIQFLESVYGLEKEISSEEYRELISFSDQINIVDIASYDEGGILKKNNNLKNFMDVNQAENSFANLKYSILIDQKSYISVDEIRKTWRDKIDIVRVRLHKSELEEGLKYCKKIHDAGYKICIIPEQIAQYSIDEFYSFLKSCSMLIPFAVYIYDNLGVLRRTYIRQFIDLMDQELSLKTAIGLGLTNSIDHFDVLRQCIIMSKKRNYIIDGSCLKERGADNILSFRYIWKFINALENKSEDIKRKQQYSLIYRELYEKSHICCNLEDYIAAKNQCNPMYAYYYVHKKGVNTYELDNILKRIPCENKYFYDEDNAKKFLSKYREEYWGKKLAIIIVTANREASIKYYLQIVAEMFHIREIDLIIFDSSSNYETKKIVQKYRYEGYTHIYYDFFDGEFDGVSIDEKVIMAYKKYAKKYEYLWVSRDGIIINLEFVINDLDVLMNKGVDLIVVDDSFRDIHWIGTKYYDDVRIFFKERCMQMTVLGATIIKSTLIRKIIDAEPLDKIRNYGMWQPIAFFSYICDKKIKMASYVGPLFLPNLKATTSSFWTKRLLWQWGERWYTMVSGLPDIYEPFKEHVLKDEMVDFQPFSIRFLAKCRENKGLTINQIKKYKKYIPYVCETPLWKFYVLAIIPESLIKFVVNKPQSLFYNISQKLYRFCLVDR